MLLGKRDKHKHAVQRNSASKGSEKGRDVTHAYSTTSLSGITACAQHTLAQAQTNTQKIKQSGTSEDDLRLRKLGSKNGARYLIAC
mgnify:FL=1